MKLTPPTTLGGDITCRTSVAFVSLLRDGELDTDDRTRLDTHLLGCPRCQVAKQQFERLYGALDQLLDRPAASSD